MLKLMECLGICEYVEQLTYLYPLQGLDPLIMVESVDKGWAVDNPLKRPPRCMPPGPIDFFGMFSDDSLIQNKDIENP